MKRQHQFIINDENMRVRTFNLVTLFNQKLFVQNISAQAYYYFINTLKLPFSQIVDFNFHQYSKFNITN